ncbi:MAG TPA: hypothetical protein VMY41_04545 [Thermohalobaculum sp.]|nr:hypothetical protein [Thermohalobaculum sp.]
MKNTRESTDLETFLASLPDAEAAEARVAAARIDALENLVGPPNWIERNLVLLAVVTLGLFVTGVTGLIGVFAWGRETLGLGGVTLMVSAFPTLVFAYLFSVRGQTRFDHAKMALNERHFLPHGGLYFGTPSGSGKVVRVDPPKTGEPTLREQIEAQHHAASTRKW